MPRPFDRLAPSVEREPPHRVAEQKARPTIVVDNHRARRQIIDIGGPQTAVGGARQTSTAVMALGGRPSIEFVGQKRSRGFDGASHRVAVGAIGLPPAHRTRAMPGSRPATGSSRKKIGVQRPGAARGKRQPRNEVIEPYQAVDPSIVRGLGNPRAAIANVMSALHPFARSACCEAGARLAQLADALSADQDVRIDVIRTFIKIGDPTAGQYLIPFFHDSNQKVRTQAMVAAGLLKFRPAVVPLLSVYGPRRRDRLRKSLAQSKGSSPIIRRAMKPPCGRSRSLETNGPNRPSSKILTTRTRLEDSTLSTVLRE